MRWRGKKNGMNRWWRKMKLEKINRISKQTNGSHSLTFNLFSKLKENAFFILYRWTKLHNQPYNRLQWQHLEMFVYPLDPLVQPVLCFSINFLTIYPHKHFFFVILLRLSTLLLLNNTSFVFYFFYIECEDICSSVMIHNALQKHKSNMTTALWDQHERVAYVRNIVTKEIWYTLVSHRHIVTLPSVYTYDHWMKNRDE